MNKPRLLLCRHCKVWQTVDYRIPDSCPQCKKAAYWATPEALNPRPFRLTQDDRTFLRVNKIAAWDNPEDDDGA